MQDIIVLVILLVIVGGAIRYIYKAKKNGARCIGCSAGGCCYAKGKKSPAEEESYVLTPEIEAAFPHVYHIGVGGMTCENCKKHVEKAFFAKGYLCKVDLKAAVAEVKSRQEVSEEALGQIVTEAGYIYCPLK